MPAKDWRELYKKYRGQWVALQKDEQTVIAAAPTLREARQKAAEQGIAHPIMTKMPHDLRIFVG
jgi:hypothetical protein